MAEIISIRVNVSDSDYKRTTGRLLEIQKYVDTLNKTPIHIKIDDTGFEKATKQITAYNNSVARMVKAENELAVAKEKTAQAQAKAEAEAWKAEQQETRLATAQVNRHTQTIRQQTEIIKGENQIALQKEKTATVVARTAQEEAKANTALVQGQARLAVQQEKTATAAARAEAAQRGQNAAMQEGSAASSLLNNSLGSLVLQYVSIRMIISKVSSAFREALNTMKEVDSELVTIQKTTGYSGEQLDRLTDSAYKLASAYGRTATEILNAASVYARAGFKENLEDMTELSALLQNVGDLTGEAAAKFLVATNAAWQMNGSYENLLRVIDGLNQQTNEAAVDMNALTSGITVAGSVFSNAGESVQTFAGLLGAGVALTQRSGSEIGRGLRTIAMNIRQIKGELDDGEIIDEASISDAAAALHSVGVSVADANGELRLTSDVLTDLAAKWGSLTTAEQSYLSQSLAGKRQANILNALMSNWQEVERQMTLYANGAGSAMKENEIYLDSWEAKTKQLSAAWTEFVANLVETDAIKGALDGLISLVKMLDSDFGHFLVTAAAIPTVILTLTTAVSKLAGAFNILKTAMITNPVLMAIAAGAITAAGAVALYNALTTTAEEYQQATKEAAQEEENLLREIAELESREENLTELERTKLDLLKQQVVEARKQKELAAYQQYNDKYGPSAASLNPALDEVNQLISQYQYRSQQARNESDPSKKLGLIGASEDAIKKLREMKTELEEYSELMGGKFPEDGQKALNTINNFLWYLDEGKTAVEASRQGMQQAAEDLNNVEKEANEAAPSFKTLSDVLKEASEKATSFDTVIAAVITALQNFGAESYEVNQAMKNLEQIIPGSTEKLYDFSTATWKIDASLIESKADLLDFIDTQKQLEFSNAISQLEDMAAAYWDVAGAALAAMTNQQAQAQMAGVLAFTAGGMNPNDAVGNVDTQLASVRQQKADWDAYVATLRARSSYKPDTSGTGRGSYTPVSSAPENTKDPELERLKAIVSLEKAELSFLQASGKSLDEINAKRKVIQAALHDEAEYLRGQLEILKAEEVAEEDKAEHEAKIKALEEEILGLSTEWWNIQKNINDDLAKAEEERLKKLEEEKKLLEEQKKLQQEMFDTLKKQVDEYYDKLVADKEKELTLEERILAVQQAEAALANAQKERTVRYYNAATGQWEWQANAKNVKSAQDALKKAQDDLNKYQREQAWKEFKSAWEYVTEQIKAGAMTFKEAYDYMYDAMTRIQDTYGVDLGYVLEDSIGGFKDLNYGIDGLTQEVANSLGASVGVLDEKLKQYETAVGAFKDTFDEASEKIKNGEWTMEDAYSYLRDRAKEIADKYGIDMTGALEEAIAGMDKTNMSIDELWKAVIINLMKVNSARWFDANDEEKKMLHAQNEYLGRLIGATYDPSGYWYLNGSQLYGSQKGVDYSGKTTGYGNFTGSGGGYGISSGGGGSGGSGGGSGVGLYLAGVGSSGVRGAAGTGQYYDSYGNTYATLEEAIMGNAAISMANGSRQGKAYGKAFEIIAKKINSWTDPELWAELSGLESANPEYAAALKQLESAAAGGASQEEMTAMINALYSGEGGTFGSINNGDTTTGWVKAGYGNANGEHLLILNGKLYQSGVDAGTMLQDLWGNRWEVGADGHTLTPMDRAWEAMTDLDNNDLTMAGANAMSDTTASAPAPMATKNVTNNRGDTYNLGGISIGEQAAKTTTVFELARMAGQLGQYKGAV